MPSPGIIGRARLRIIGCVRLRFQVRCGGLLLSRRGALAVRLRKRHPAGEQENAAKRLDNASNFLNEHHREAS